MSNADDARWQGTAGGFLAPQHHELRFTELSEAFFGRLILVKCPDPSARAATTVHLSLCDLFRRAKAEELLTGLQDVTFTSSSKIVETCADLISAVVGVDLKPKTRTEPALDYYQNHIASRLHWLKAGDKLTDRLPCIEDFTPRADGKLIVFEIVVRPAVLRERIAEYIVCELELTGKLFQRLDTGEHRPSDPGPRIEYHKEIELLTHYLDGRQGVTGETAFSILSNQIPFRWAIEEYAGGVNVTTPAVGTSTVADKILLPLLLEVNGLLDILGLDLESDPLEPNDVVVRYSIRRPATRNIFGAENAGLDAATRSQLNETELALYHRLHAGVRQGLVFGGKPNLERSFGALCSWLIRKASYCLQEPTFMARPARDWINRHAKDKIRQMENQFFLPAIYERLRSDFGSRVVKKPERFGGEIDILFDDTVPIELKVRHGRKEPLDVSAVDATFKAGGQAAAYAAISRLGFVVVLDLPGTDAQIVSLENCAAVIERRFPETSAYPTCIAVIAFRCCEIAPSASR